MSNSYTITNEIGQSSIPIDADILSLDNHYSEFNNGNTGSINNVANENIDELNEASISTEELIPVKAQKITEKVKNYIHSTQRVEDNDYFLSIQKWKGVITSISDETFEARLEDLINSDTYEIGEFELKEVSPGDLELFKMGAAFYWSVGYANNHNQREKKSIIRFQRLPSWTEDELDKASDRRNDLFDFLS
jgi:uncharacterized protein YoaH (UPF0181 family)